MAVPASAGSGREYGRDTPRALPSREGGAQQIKLKLPVDQWFSGAAAACFGRFAAVVIP